jgi:hypothetical protein
MHDIVIDEPYLNEQVLTALKKRGTMNSTCSLSLVSLFIFMMLWIILSYSILLIYLQRKEEFKGSGCGR